MCVTSALYFVSRYEQVGFLILFSVLSSETRQGMIILLAALGEKEGGRKSNRFRNQSKYFIPPPPKEEMHAHFMEPECVCWEINEYWFTESTSRH